MTKNTIEYNKLLESRRANKASEALSRTKILNDFEASQRAQVEVERANRMRESLDRQQLKETQRANIAREAETRRANLANETILLGRLAEDQRSHQAQEAISSAYNQEVARANLARETETTRANRVREIETQRANLAHEQIQRDTLNESIRHSQATEATQRYAAEMNAKYQQQSIGLGYSQLAEQSRSNRIRESISLQQQEEVRRSNVANETIRLSQIDVERRQLSETARANLAREAENSRHNVMAEQESMRHNKAMEEQARVDTMTTRRGQNLQYTAQGLRSVGSLIPIIGG